MTLKKKRGSFTKWNARITKIISPLGENQNSSGVGNTFKRGEENIKEEMNAQEMNFIIFFLHGQCAK